MGEASGAGDGVPSSTGSADVTGPAPAGARSARYATARARLGGAQKSPVGVPAYLRFVNRRIGGHLAAIGYALGLTPNHLTAVSAAFSLAAVAAVALVEPGPAMSVAVALALLAGFAFDSADGQLSRVRGDGKPSGEWLDHVVDAAKTASLHAAVAVSLDRFADLDQRGWILVPLGFGIVSLTFQFAMMLRDQLGGRPSAPPAGAGAVAPGSTLRSFVLLPMDYGALCLVFVTLAWPSLFLALYGGLFLLTVAFSAQSFVKAYRALAI